MRTWDKPCTICGINKPPSEYYVKSPGKLESKCKACMKARSAKNRAKRRGAQYKAQSACDVCGKVTIARYATCYWCRKATKKAASEAKRAELAAQMAREWGDAIHWRRALIEMAAECRQLKYDEPGTWIVWARNKVVTARRREKETPAKNRIKNRTVGTWKAWSVSPGSGRYELTPWQMWGRDTAGNCRKRARRYS